MLSNLLINAFIGKNKDIKTEEVRNKFGYLAGFIGIISNFCLFIVKFFVGFVTGSIAITADAFNNLTDALSSVITIAGFKLSSMPADEEHPFGHGRIEYIAALVVAFLIIIVGVEFVKSSFIRIINPTPVKFEIIPFILVILTIFAKLWLAHFNKVIGNKIDSDALKATSLDALGDVFTSTCVAISLLLSKFTAIPIDGYVGIGVSLFILYSGFMLIKETVNPLLGESADPELVDNIKKELLQYEHVTGVHDLIIHNYGVGKFMASIHAELPAELGVVPIHEIIDKAEREISEKLNIYLVIHMDPISPLTEEVAQAKKEVEKIIKYNPLIKSMHDFRTVCGKDKKTILFDLVVNPSTLKKVMTKEKLIADVKKAVETEHPDYNCIIDIDYDFNDNDTNINNNNNAKQ